MGKAKTEEQREKCFAASAQFSYGSFLWGGTAVCGTLRELDVQFPAGEKRINSSTSGWRVR